MNPTKSSCEKKRIQAIGEYHLLDTLPERDFDNITSLAAKVCNVPISVISIIDADRIFLKSHYGLNYNQTKRDGFFCDHTMNQGHEMLIVEDARLDHRFKDHPKVIQDNLIFYAGVPLINPYGFVLGTLCVFDTVPRKLTKQQKEILYSLAYQVIRLFKVRKYNRSMMHYQEELKKQNQKLKDFAGIVSHDMKMPLANMILTSDIIRSKYGKMLDEQAHQYLENLKQSSLNLSEYVNGLLEHYQSENTAAKEISEFNSLDLFEDVIELLNIQDKCEINLPEEKIELKANFTAMEQIFLNLMGNSLKYNDKEKTIIDIDCKEDEDYYTFRISDNGQGIPKDELKDIFKLFKTTSNRDKQGNSGSGIGLSTVQKLIKKLGGEIFIFSEVGKGTAFKFTIEKR